MGGGEDIVDEPVVRAAGGLLWRPGPNGRREFALVHRPRYDDWTFPKGKLVPGETDEEAALREVEEETGFRCRLGSPVGAIRYRDRKGRPKIVRYWSMTPVGGSFAPTNEVDELRWHAPDRAEALLTYDHDRGLLRSFLHPSAPAQEDPGTGRGGS